MAKNEVETARVTREKSIVLALQKACHAWLGLGFSMHQRCAHATGVTMSETTAEITIAATNVSAISWKRRPTRPPMKTMARRPRRATRGDRDDRERDLFGAASALEAVRDRDRDGA